MHSLFRSLFGFFPNIVTWNKTSFSATEPLRVSSGQPEQLGFILLKENLPIAEENTPIADVAIEVLASIEVIADVPIEVITEVPIEIIADVPIEVFADVPIEVFADIPIEVVGDIPMEVIADVPIEVIADVPIEVIADVPIEVIADVPIEVIADVPIEVIADVPIEVISKETEDFVTIPAASKISSTAMTNVVYESDGDSVTIPAVVVAPVPSIPVLTPKQRLHMMMLLSKHTRTQLVELCLKQNLLKTGNKENLAERLALRK
jgi:hypothetical protein